MKRILTLVFAVALCASYAQAQADFGFKTKQLVTSDFNTWTAHSSTTIASGSGKTITIENPWQPTAPGAGSFQPFRTSRKLLIASEDPSVDETVTITSASCTTPQSCTITATFSYAHSGRYSVKSGTFGLQEAIDYLPASGGAVVIPADSAVTDAMITAALGTSTKRIVDLRDGTHIEVAYNGSYSSGSGAAAGTGVTANENLSSGSLHQTVITLTGAVVTVANTSGASFGNLKVYDFPEGYLYLVSSVVNLSFDWAGTDIAAAGSGDFGLGTTGTSDATIATTDVDILASTALTDPFVSGVGTGAGALVVPIALDGHSGAKDVFINIIIDDADVDDLDTDPVTVTGTITLTWISSGDR